MMLTNMQGRGTAGSKKAANKKKHLRSIEAEIDEEHAKRITDQERNTPSRRRQGG